MSKGWTARRLVWLSAIMVGLSVTMGQAQTTRPRAARSALVTSGIFVLDESVSALTISGTLAGVPFQPQGPGADTTSYSGTIAADFDLDAGTILFTPGGVATAANSGNWQPLRDGALGSEPANYGGQVSVFFQQVLLAFRDLAFSNVTDQSIPLMPAGGGVYTFESMQTVAVTAGSDAYHAGAFGSGSVDLTGLMAQNSAPPGTLQDFGDGTFGLTVPIEATYTQDVFGVTATLHVSGSIAGIAVPDGAAASAYSMRGPLVNLELASRPQADGKGLDGERE
jgi:hypothetical protein